MGVVFGPVYGSWMLFVGRCSRYVLVGHASRDLRPVVSNEHHTRERVKNDGRGFADDSNN